jgi:hypothetical protein
VAALKRGLEAQQNVFRKQSNDCCSALWASYRITHLLAKESKPFSDGEFVRNVCNIVQEIRPEKETVLEL